MAVTSMAGKAAWNKSSLLLNNILQNTQTLQLFKEIIKAEIVYKSNKKSQAGRLG